MGRKQSEKLRKINKIAHAMRIILVKNMMAQFAHNIH